METIKRVYTKPVILRVVLNHEQAVLAKCSTRTTSLKAGGGGFCNSPPTNCRNTTRCDDDASATS